MYQGIGLNWAIQPTPDRAPSPAILPRSSRLTSKYVFVAAEYRVPIVSIAEADDAVTDIVHTFTYCQIVRLVFWIIVLQAIDIDCSQRTAALVNEIRPRRARLDQWLRLIR